MKTDTVKPIDPKQVDRIINNHMILSIGAGLVPIPLLDMVAVTAIQLDMLKKLAEHHDVNYDEQRFKSWMHAIGGTILARLGASTIKAIPVFGSIFGGISMAALSGASTYAMGKVFNDHFENGGDLEYIDMDKAKEFFKQKFEEGKEMAKQMVPKVEEEQKAQSEKSAEERLADITKMKEDGLITEREFEAIRKRILKA